MKSEPRKPTSIQGPAGSLQGKENLFDALVNHFLTFLLLLTVRKREGCKVRCQANSSSADATQGKEQLCPGKLSSERGTQYLPSRVMELRARNQDAV